MTFRITRTSSTWDDYGNPLSPHPLATSVHRTHRFDVRTLPTPAAFDARRIEPEPWLSVGTDHTPITLRSGAPGIRRTLPCDYLEWVIDLDPSALLDFIAPLGPCILTPPDPLRDLHALWELEIYDTFRE